jgi:hypothetical protein
MSYIRIEKDGHDYKWIRAADVSAVHVNKEQCYMQITLRGRELCEFIH